jgi:DNA-directed DNA polymerase III PolC
MFIPLTAYSAYSLQEGLLLPSELVEAAKAQNLPALGLTDHRLLSGAVEFAVACQRVGIQPVLGLEINLLENSGLAIREAEAGGAGGSGGAPDGLMPSGRNPADMTSAGQRLSLLAMNLNGWSNLCRLSSAIERGDIESPTRSSAGTTPTGVPIAFLSKVSDDLIAILPSPAQTAQDEAEPLVVLKVIFKDRLYAALDDPGTAVRRSMLAHRLKIPCVVTHPVYYLSPEQESLQRTLSAIRLNLSLNKLPPGAAAPKGSHFPSQEEIESQFSNFPSAVEATQEIAARCKFDLPLGIPHMPTVPLPPGLTAAQYLRERAEAGARRLYGDINPRVRERLDHELEVIAKMGFEPIFLIVEEILNYARQTGVPFSSRGSAASSLVAHCLGITSPDPLRLDLYFERFLNPARSTPPDIDTDLCSRGRDSVIQHVFDKYGEDRAAMVCTINRFRPRSSLGDVAKAHGIEPQKVREMVNQLPYAFWSRFEQNEEGETPPSPFAELRAVYTSPGYQRIFEEAEALLKLPRHLSVHPGGMVIAPGKITDLVPIMRSGSKGVTITQFDLESVEALGLVKIDLLGIRGLTVLGDVTLSGFEPHERYPTGTKPAGPISFLESIPADDAETSRRVQTGETIGCFQIESPGMRATLREIRAHSEDDLMAALALYRPGPLSGGLKDAFVRRFKGEEPVHHIHPALEPLLAETFGVILYQEQVLRIAHELAGFSLTEADLLRRAMSHFDPGKRMQELKVKFINEAQSRSGIPPGTGERVWEMMAAFAGYGFPKAHAASYAKVAWRSAWCKTHFPAEFMAAVLANWGGYYSQRVYLSEARRLRLTVRPPNVNFSGRNFTVGQGPQGGFVPPMRHPAGTTPAGPQGKALYMGMDQVRDLTGRTMERIIHGRPFHSLEDFLARADPRPQEAVNLAKVGALEDLGTIPAVLRRVQGGSWQRGQPSLFEWEDTGGEDWSLEQKMAAQQELLGISLEAHPLELLIDKIAAANAVSTLDALERIGQRVTVAGVRQTSHRSRTAKGETMMFLTIEDLSGALDMVVFPDVYRRSRELLSSSSPVFVTGMMEMDASRGEPFLKAEMVIRVE